MPMKRPCHPGLIAKEAIVNGLEKDPAAVGLQMGVPLEDFFHILNGRKDVTPEMAMLFEEHIGSTAETWIRMQTAYDRAQGKQEC